MRQSFHPAGWWKIILGGLAGAALVSGSPWASRGSQQAEQGPLGEKFWPSEFGADDQRGAANRITPAKVASAARLVKQRADLPAGTALRTRHADSGQTALQPDDPRTAHRAAHRVEQRRSRMMSWSAVRSARSGPSSTGSATLVSASTARTISTTATNCPSLAIRTV